MIPSKLLAKIHARGLTTHLDQGELVVRGPSDRITTKLCRLIREHKPGLVELLTPEQTAPSDRLPVREGPPAAAIELLLDDRWLLPFGAKRLPFTVWDGQQMSGRRIAIDTETTPIVAHQVPRLILASVSDGTDHFILTSERIAEFLERHSRAHFVAHNMTFDHWVLVEHLGPQADLWWQLADHNRLHCTDILERLILLAKRDCHPSPHSLESLAQYYLGTKLFGKDDPRRQQFDSITDSPLEKVDPWFLQYAMQDAVAVVGIHRQQYAIAKKYQPASRELLENARNRFGLLSETLQVRGAIALSQVTRHGMHLDPARIGPAREALLGELFLLAKQLQDEAGVEVLQRYHPTRSKKSITTANRGFVLNATGYPKVKQDVVRKLFTAIAKEQDLQPPTAEKSGKLSLTKDYWSDYRDLSPVIDLYLELQAKGKTLSFFKHLRGDHIHPIYNPIVRSGRVSCRDPNIQQMPRRGNVREMFIPRPGCVLLAIDYAALELRTLAAICLKKYGKSQLAEVINQGSDPHAFSYCKIHDMSPDDFLTWKQRDPQAAKAARDAIKGVTFGVPGSMQPAGLVAYVKKSYGQHITVEQADEYRRKLLEVCYPEWSQYLKQRSTTVHTLTGRVRGRLQRAGQLFNSQFQGLAGDGAKDSLWRLMRAGYRVIAFVHDEFLIELPANTDHTAAAREIERICCATMAEFTPGVEIAAEYTLSDCWSKQAEAVYENGVLQVWTPDH